MVKKYKTEKISTMEVRCSFFKKNINDINFIKNGGWHFTNIKTPENIDYKMKNFLHHLEYEKVV